jgi:hypothetical protein
MPARRSVGGEGFAVDASLIAADANKQRSTPGEAWNIDKLGPDACRVGAGATMANNLFYGDNFAVLRERPSNANSNSASVAT